MDDLLRRFEDILHSIIKKQPNNTFLELEFCIFDNAKFGGEDFEFLSMIVNSLNAKKERDYFQQEIYDLVREIDEIPYEDFISIAKKLSLNNNLIVIDNSRKSEKTKSKSSKN